MRIAQEEIFGPTTALIRVPDFEEAIRVANGIEFGLSSSIFTRDVNRAFRAMRDLETGITYINAGTTGAEVHLPFGGTKRHGQRPPGGRPGRARRLHRVEVDLRRLLRQAPARADRQRRAPGALSGSQGQPRRGARQLRRGLPAAHRRVLQRQQDPGGEDTRRVRVALASRDGRLLPRRVRPADDPAPRPRRRARSRRAVRRPRRRRALPAVPTPRRTSS